MHETHGPPVARRCTAVRMARFAFYQQSTDWENRDAEVVAELNELVAAHPHVGAFGNISFASRP